MSLLYRVILFMIVVVFIFAALLFGLYSFGVSEANLLPEMIYSIYGSWEAGICFLIAFIAAAWVIYPFFIREEGITLISETELGEVDISLSALDNLVNSIALKQEGVEAINNRLQAREEGLDIFLNSKVSPGIPIPAITENLQQVVKSYIEETTGVKVAKVKVRVEGIMEKEIKRAE